MNVPDYCEPIVAWRAWRVLHNGVLSGLAVSQPWAPKRTFVAACNGHTDARTGDVSVHLTPRNEWLDAPAQGCVCGIYAAKTREAVEGERRAYTRESETWMQVGRVPTMAFAVGEVSLWGRVIEHRHGYRAQYAYPKALTVYGEPALADLAGQLYAVPVTVGKVEPTARTIEDDNGITIWFRGAQSLKTTHNFWRNQPPNQSNGIQVPLTYQLIQPAPAQSFDELVEQDTALKAQKAIEAAARHKERTRAHSRGWRLKPWF